MHVIINGVSSETLQGVQVLSLPPITKPRMRTSVAVIDGRPGDIVTRLGYEAYNRKIRILLHHDYDIDAISAFFNTSGKIIFSNEPDMEYEFETIDAFSFERAVRYKTADITFHVQPYKLSTAEEPATGEVSTLVDKTPYIIRRTPFGTRQKGTIVGGSVAWNQLIDVTTKETKTSQGITYTNNGDGSFTLTGTPTSSNTFENINYVAGVNPYILDHVYLMYSGYTGDKKIGVYVYGMTSVRIAVYSTPIIQKADQIGTNGYARFQVTDLQDTDIGTVKLTPQLFDLTLMFGTEIADYIYAQEQATAGAGVALAKAWAGITADYYPYDAGSIKSVTGLTAHKMTGKNIFGGDALKDGIKASMPSAVVDETGKTVKFNSNATVTQPIVEGIFAENTRYTFIFTLVKDNTSTSSNIKITYTDGTTTLVPITSAINEKQTVRTISAEGKTVASLDKNYQSGSTTVYYEESGIFRGVHGLDAFEPYTAHTYPLDSSLTLRGRLQLDGDSIYYDGDIYPPSGEVKRKYQLDDLTTIVWTKRATGTVNDGYSGTLTSAYTSRNYNYIPPFICDKYRINGSTNASLMVANVDTMEVGLYGYRYVGNTTVIYAVVPTGTSISGNLLYELATPTTEQAEPYTALQICDPAGTEEWVGASMPVGHETAYIDPISMTVTNEGNTESAPSITIEGEGAVEVTVDGLNILQIQMPSPGEITIDSKTLDATDGEGGLANRSVTGDYNDLRLAPGEHTVTVTGDVTSVTIKNASRWI